MVGGITAQYEKGIVVTAGLATALVTIALTVYAMTTKHDISVFVGLAFVVYLAMFPIIIISFFMNLGGVLYTVYLCLGILLYSLYLIIDTIMITGGKSMNGYGCDLDDYVIGAMMLYMDIIMLFIYILRLLGGKD